MYILYLFMCLLYHDYSSTVPEANIPETNICRIFLSLPVIWHGLMHHYR